MAASRRALVCMLLLLWGALVSVSAQSYAGESEASDYLDSSAYDYDNEYDQDLEYDLQDDDFEEPLVKESKPPAVKGQVKPPVKPPVQPPSKIQLKGKEAVSSQVSPKEATALKTDPKRFKRAPEDKAKGCKKFEKWSQTLGKCYQRRCKDGYRFSKTQHKCVKRKCKGGFKFSDKTQKCQLPAAAVKSKELNVAIPKCPAGQQPVLQWKCT